MPVHGMRRHRGLPDVFRLRRLRLMPRNRISPVALFVSDVRIAKEAVARRLFPVESTSIADRARHEAGRGRRERCEFASAGAPCFRFHDATPQAAASKRRRSFISAMAFVSRSTSAAMSSRVALRK